MEKEATEPNPLTAAESRELLEAIAAGDKDAFEVFARAVAPFVHGRISKIVWDSTAAEDVTQAVMVKLWSQAGRFTCSRGNAFAWITTIARNTAIDHLRSEERVRKIANAAKQNVDTTSEDSLQQALRSEESSELFRALDRLTQSQRKAIELAYFHDLTYVEVAERLGEPEGTVKARIRRAMIQLARLLKETHES